VFDLSLLKVHRCHHAARQPRGLADNHPRHPEKVADRVEHFHGKKGDLDRLASSEEAEKKACQPPRKPPSVVEQFQDFGTPEGNRAQEDGQSEKVQPLLHRYPRETQLFLAQQK
jgi:hypothetical protein